jgi:MMPL family
VVLPVKAVVLVVLSLGASLGTLLLLVSTRLGATLIGANGPQDIHPIVPITMVAITVALSTDYEVILISRIAEHYRRTGDNRAAVVSGIEHTGSVITSAAAIMVAVFAGFASADLLPVKQLGVGLALAVFLDATVVRGVLVPAAMAVMGRGNWWWPRLSRQQHGTALPQEMATPVPPQRVIVPALPPRNATVPVQEVATTVLPHGTAIMVPSPRAAATVPLQKIAATVLEASVSLRDEKQAVGAFDGHAFCICGADLGPVPMLADRHHRHESGAGWIHYNADVTQTVVLERPSAAASELMSTESSTS